MRARARARACAPVFVRAYLRALGRARVIPCLVQGGYIPTENNYVSPGADDYNFNDPDVYNGILYEARDPIRPAQTAALDHSLAVKRKAAAREGSQAISVLSSSRLLICLANSFVACLSPE